MDDSCASRSASSDYLFPCSSLSAFSHEIPASRGHLLRHSALYFASCRAAIISDEEHDAGRVPGNPKEC